MFEGPYGFYRAFYRGDYEAAIEEFVAAKRDPQRLLDTFMGRPNEQEIRNRVRAAGGDVNRLRIIALDRDEGVEDLVLDAPARRRVAVLSACRVKGWRLGLDNSLTQVSTPCRIKPYVRFSLIRLTDNLPPLAFKAALHALYSTTPATVRAAA